LALCVLAIVAWLAALHLRLVLSTAPMEWREGAALHLTGLLLDGRSPYALAEMPAATNVYGILYHLVVAPLAALAGNDFPVHRAVTAVAILGACWLLYALLRARRTPALLAFAGAALLYAQSLYFVGPMARPDGLGLFLSLACLAILLQGDLGPRAFAAALAVAALAVATKPYFAWPVAAAAVHVLLFRSWRRGLAYGAAVAATVGGTLLVLGAAGETYLTNVLVVNARTGGWDASHLLAQAGDYALLSLPLAVAAVLPGRGRASPSTGEPDPAWSTCAVAALLLAVVLGGHRGAHLTYFTQLLTAPLALAVLPRLADRRLARIAVLAAIPVASVANAPLYRLDPGAFAVAEAATRRVDDEIRHARSVLSSPEFAGLLARAGRPVHDTGQSEYFFLADGPAALAVLPGFVAPEESAGRRAAFVAAIEAGLRDRTFDLVVLGRRERWLIPDALLDAGYERTGTVPAPHAWARQDWAVDLWRPRGGQATTPAAPPPPAR